MQYVYNDENTVREFSLVVFGQNVIKAAIPFLPLKQLKLVASSAHLDKITFDSRVQSLSDSGVSEAGNIARHGFFFIPCNASASPSIVCCVCCDAKMPLHDCKSATESSRLHEQSCLYFTFLSDEVDHDTSTQLEQDNNLVIHLRKELAKTRTFVMEEMGFSKDFVCIVLTRRFLRGQTGLANAGQLVDALNNAEDSLGEELAQKLLPGIAGFIISIRLPLCAPQQPEPQQQQRPQHPEPEPSAPSTILDKKKRFEKLRSETLKLLLMTKCKGCNRGANVEFVALPCSHFCLCGVCAPKFTHCPVCHDQILDLIKAYGP